MKIIYPFIFLIFPAFSLLSQPLQLPVNHNIIIDTDCGIDDYRAINFLLSRPEICVNGILISDGNINPEEGFGKVMGLLNEIGRDSIPVGCGRILNGQEPPWRNLSQSLKWSNSTTPVTSQKSAVDLLTEILSSGDKKISLVCLGPLTNISDFLEKNQTLINRIDRIIWSNDYINPFRGFNYEYDSLALFNITRCNLRLDVISNPGYPEAIFDTAFMADNNKQQSGLASIFRSFYNRNKLQQNIHHYQLKMYDELAAVYLLCPSLFDMNPLPGKTRIRYNSGYNLPAVSEVINDMIHGRYFAERNVVFTRFPFQREYFSYDVRQIMDSVIARYGAEEWKACVITDEFHGHLGVYSIVGAKMGIKAREFFGVGPDILKVVSYAGIKPPYSCLTDGIQVSTGSTLGMGLISVAPGIETSAIAEFTCQDRTIRISLKEEYVKKVESDITAGIVKFGLMDDGYWKMIRQSALKYWLEWDRDKIFDIQELGKEAEKKKM